MYFLIYVTWNRFLEPETQNYLPLMVWSVSPVKLHKELLPLKVNLYILISLNRFATNFFI